MAPKYTPAQIREYTANPANNLLVKALVEGKKDDFENLLKTGTEINGKLHKADIAALDNEVITEIIGNTRQYFNIGVKPKDSFGSKLIIDDLCDGKYTGGNKDTSEINLPAMAAYFNDIDLMDRLIKEEPGRDFGLKITNRGSTAIALASSNAREYGEPDMASLLLDNAEKIGLKLEDTRTGIAELYATNKTKLEEFLDKIPKLSNEDIQELAARIPAAMVGATEMAKSATTQEKATEAVQKFQKVTGKILEAISANHEVGPKAMEHIARAMQEQSGEENPPISHTHIQMLQKTAGKMLHDPANAPHDANLKKACVTLATAGGTILKRQTQAEAEQNIQKPLNVDAYRRGSESPSTYGSKSSSSLTPRSSTVVQDGSNNVRR